MGVILELPIGCQTRNETLLAIGAVGEEYQRLVGILQNNVVDLILLLLKIQGVDVRIRADHQSFLVRGHCRAASALRRAAGRLARLRRRSGGGASAAILAASAAAGHHSNQHGYTE